MTITAGVTLAFDLNFTAYPADRWTMTLYLRGASAIDVTATADGNRHRFNVSATQTAKWTTGVYRYEVRATSNDGEVALVDAGRGLEINPDLTAISEPSDARGHALKVLEAIEAVIEGRARKDQSKYKINNRELERTPIPDLLALRREYRAEVWREKRKAQGKSPFQHIRVRFN